MSLFDYELDERLLQSYTVAFSVPYDDPKAAHIREDIVLTIQSEKFFVTEVKKRREGSEVYLDVKGEATWYRLADMKRIGSFELAHRTAKQGLTKILDGTGWHIDEVTDDPETYSLEEEDGTVLDLLWKWAKICDCEIFFNTRSNRVSFVPMVGRLLGLSFRYGRNVTEITQTITPPRATRLYCFGRNGLTFTYEGKKFIEDFSFYTDQGLSLAQARALYRKDEIYRDDDAVTAKTLLKMGKARMRLLSQPSVLYQATVLDLSRLIGTPETDYRCGDRVSIYDDVIGLAVQARVSRIVRYPKDPARNQVELTVGAIDLPDPSTGTSREDSTKSWQLIESRNRSNPRQVRDYHTILNKLSFSSVEDSQYVLGYKLQATGVGSGTVWIESKDEATDEVVWPIEQVTVAPGSPFEFNFTAAAKELTQGTHDFVIRAYSSSSSVGLNIDKLCSAYWILAQGVSERTSVAEEEALFGPTESPIIGTFWRQGRWDFQVPDDVHEITITAAGGSGSSASNGRAGGKGAVVTAKFNVSPGDWYQVYVGEAGASNRGWPNGGQGHDGPGHNYGGGGGSTSVHPAVVDGLPRAADPKSAGYDWNLGMGPNATTIISSWESSFPNALIVAAGGGSTSAALHPQDTQRGGPGSFYGGEDADGGNFPGSGATQFSGGVGIDPGESGSFMYAGNGYRETGSLKAFGGGGGGGWYGGAAGTHLGGEDGGGGSSWIRSDGYDIKFEDNANGHNGLSVGGKANEGAGWVRIEWDSPDN